MRITRLAGFAMVLAILGCAHDLRPCDRMTTDPVMEKRHLVRHVESEDIRIEYLAAVDAASLAGEPRKAVEEWIDEKVRQLKARMQLGDQLYFYRYEKCCGWYREGYVAVRGECIVGEINTREDM